MTKIDRVYIATHRDDLRLTRICVASIRYWYPEIPIYLLKDEANGHFDTNEIEKRFNVQLCETAARSFGWGFIKLEPLFDSTPTRYLVLDSDIVFIGRVLDALEVFDGDFVVQEELQPAADVPRLYYDTSKIRASINPAFGGAAYTFNTGQYVATSGIVQRAAFDGLVQWSEPRRVILPEMFNPSEQGVLNYVLLEMQRSGLVTVARTPFMKWGREELAEFELARLASDSPYPFLIHWAGLKRSRLGKMLRADILEYFERCYYDRIPFGRLRRAQRIVRTDLARWVARLSNLTRTLSMSFRVKLGGLGDA